MNVLPVSSSNTTQKTAQRSLDANHRRCQRKVALQDKCKVYSATNGGVLAIRLRSS